MVTSNECKLTRETVCMPMQIPETVQEQSVELDYVLPDYFPDFFRLVHCSAEPTVLQWECKDGTLSYVLCVRLRIWYCAEQSVTVQCVTQRMEYTKQVPLPNGCDCDSIGVQILPATSYLNCRAINSRRIDVRGAIRIAVLFTAETKKEILCNVTGLHTRCRKEPMTYLSRVVRAQKLCQLSEEITLADTQPPLLTLLRDCVQVAVSETRCVAGKLVVKGEALVQLLYTAAGGIETMQFAMPFSQIVEPQGLEDTMHCHSQAEVAQLNISTEADANGDIRLLRCELQLRLLCEAMAAAISEPVVDLYSTVHPTSVQTETIALRGVPVPIRETLRLQAKLSRADAVIDKVYAMWAEPKDLHIAADEEAEQMLLSGTVQYYVLAADAAGEPFLMTACETLSAPLSMSYICGQNQLGAPMVQLVNCSYTLTAADTVSVQTELQLCGYCTAEQSHTLAVDVQIDEEQRLGRDDRYALRLYFGQAQESLWEIAKGFHTSVEAIREENDCTADTLDAPQMLLIPIVL